MQKTRVNFGAAAGALLLVLGCGPSSSRQPANGSESPGARDAAQPATDPSVPAADRGRIEGDTAAKVWVIIASDFQCPYCREWHHQTYRQFMDEYVRSGKVRVAFLNFPLGQHANAFPTAEAAMCAAAQNRFWQYHDGLFESQATWAAMDDPRPVLDSIARSVGVDVEQWRKCVDSDVMGPLIMADRDRASAAGVRSTPSFLIGDVVIAGAQPLSSMRPAIDSAIARSGGSSPR